MTVPSFDLGAFLSWEEGLPRPRWSEIQTAVAALVQSEQQSQVWSDIARQWLQILAAALGSSYQQSQSDHFLLLAPIPEPQAKVLLRHAETCRDELMTSLPDIAAFRAPGKQVLIAVADADTYYGYVAVFYPEGRHGPSGGIQVREGYPHVVVCGRHLETLQLLLTHELTHAALTHLSLPAWVEEGLTQTFESSLTSRARLLVSEKLAEQHRRFWSKHGLQAFWSGKGFSSPGKVQRLSYELAEILMQLLCSEHRPRWFGRDRGPQQRLFAFLKEAHRSDSGDRAAREYLGVSLGELASRFLGPGDWWNPGEWQSENE